MNPAIFFDRDGVIIDNVSNYVRSWADVKFLPGSLSALAGLAGSFYKIVLVTNQSAVGRNILSLEQVWKVNDQIVAEIRQIGGRVDGVYICPHAPDQKCDCRKPRPGLIMQAVRELDIDLSRSYMIGDALSDLEAGRRAGVAKNVLVRTGRGAVQAQLPEAAAWMPFEVFERMETAVEAILSGHL